MSAVPVLHGEGVTLVPVGGEHVAELRRIVSMPEVRRRWGEEEVRDPKWPLEDPWATPFAIVIDDEVRGLIQYGEETGSMYRFASIDIFLDPALHGRGHRRRAITTLAGYLIDQRGHHRLTIDPAADNEQAIRCYAAVGFRRVGILRRYEHDVDGAGWHDGLLMDLLAEDLVA